MSDSRIQSFRDLDAWQAAMELMVAAYNLTARLPADERFGLTAQIRRAATSIPANIAEGHASGKRGLYRRHVHIALGSRGQLDTLFEAALRLGFITQSDLRLVAAQLGRTGQLLHGISRALRYRAIGTALAWVAAFASSMMSVGVATLR